ncbi:hypothetical protein H4S06_005441, partial [Coemansia sp. BCRC 34490]
MGVGARGALRSLLRNGRALWSGRRRGRQLWGMASLEGGRAKGLWAAAPASASASAPARWLDNEMGDAALRGQVLLARAGRRVWRIAVVGLDAAVATWILHTAGDTVVRAAVVGNSVGDYAFFAACVVLAAAVVVVASVVSVFSAVVVVAAVVVVSVVASLVVAAVQLVVSAARLAVAAFLMVVLVAVAAWLVVAAVVVVAARLTMAAVVMVATIVVVAAVVVVVAACLAAAVAVARTVGPDSQRPLVSVLIAHDLGAARLAANIATGPSAALVVDLLDKVVGLDHGGWLAAFVSVVVNVEIRVRDAVGAARVAWILVCNRQRRRQGHGLGVRWRTCRMAVFASASTTLDNTRA